MALTYNMREGEQSRGLHDLCAFVKSRLGDGISMIEIGSYCGASSKILSDNFPNSILNCVDPWESYVEDCSSYDLNRQALELKEAENIFDNMTSSKPNITKNKLPSSEYAATISPESIDFIYIDGNHQYSSVVQDISNWYPKIKKGSIIAGHDYSWETVSRALREFFQRAPDATFVDSSWCYIK